MATAKLESKNVLSRLLAIVLRISILGVWHPDKSFDYALVQGSFNKQRYTKVMNWIAQKAEQTLKQTGRITVIVQDNGSPHTSHLARQHWQHWQTQGLYLFFLPPYCSELNHIETQWHQLKSHEIAARIFDNEYDKRQSHYERYGESQPTG